jgi:nicotinate-nucleotide adenylyltransferase
MRIGLLGGSFNPAHQGHVHISHEAIKRLNLQEIWWLVSPQNPLKPTSGMAAFAERLASASAVARDPRIRVTGIEAAFGTRATADTLKALHHHLPEVSFVWLMGADNLIQMDRWARWQEIFNTTAVAVFARPTYSLRALSAKAARRFARRRIKTRASRRLPLERPPAWVFLPIRLDPTSATALRANREGQ